MRTEKAEIDGHQSCGAPAQLAPKKEERNNKKENEGKKKKGEKKGEKKN